MPAGYSGTPLGKKLGVKPSDMVMLINQPAHYFDVFTDWPADTVITTDAMVKKNFIHFFTKDAAELLSILPGLRSQLVPNGIIWVSWPKKASKLLTDVTETLVRNIALAHGLVDIKVCAVDDTWSGLKLVIPVKDRSR